MGYRDPDKVRPAEWREHFPRVELMRKARWQVWATCQGCRAWWELDLAKVERKLGPQFSLWDRHPRCKVIGCKGRTQLTARPPRVGRAFEL